MEPTTPFSYQPPQPKEIMGMGASDSTATAETWMDVATRLTGAIWWMTDHEGLIAGQHALSAYTGLPEAALTGAGWLAAIAPGDRANIGERWRVSLQSDELVETGCRFLRSNGKTAWLTVRSQMVPAAHDEPPRRLWVATQTAHERAVSTIGYYRALFGQTTQGVMLIGSQGQLFRANAVALRMLGLSLEQARGEKAPPAGWRITRDDGAQIEEPFRDAANATSGGQATHTFWQVLADDMPASRWLSVTSSPVIRSHARSQQRTMVFLTDVSERVRHREAMESMAEKSSGELAELRAALDRMTSGFIVLDYDGRFTYANAKAHEQLAPNDESLIGKRLWDVFPRLSGTELEAEYHHILREHTPRSIEALVGDNAWYEFRGYPSVDGISVYIRDITSEKRTLAELDAALAREREAHAEAEDRAQQLDTVIEAVGDGMLVFGPDGTALRANQAMRDLAASLGAELSLPMPAAQLSALLGRFEPRAEGQEPGVEAPLRRILSGESLTGERTVDLTLRVGGERTLHLNISGAPIRGSDGSIQGAVETLRDVTAKREAERERTRTLSVVAHELRTPLTAIKLAIDLTSRRARSDQYVDPATLDVAASSCRQLERMVNDLVDTARAEREKMALEFVRCDMGDLAAQAMVEQLTANDRLILFDPPQTPLPIVADPARIRQVLSNLLSNATKYSPPDTEIELHVEARDGSVWVGVADEGPGVPAEAIPHLFEAFYRAPDVISLTGPNVGLGLGLFLCKRIIDMHGGQIGMQNRPERGSLFWFTLPLASATDTPDGAATGAADDDTTS
ncbi:MAG TPA: PAS domain-containing protein [Ktedonobacterales bacterium]